MLLSHEIEGWIYDTTRREYRLIREIMVLSHDDQQWVNHGAPSEPMYALRLNDRSFTHYLTVEQLNELYPYIGKNVATIEVLYGPT